MGDPLASDNGTFVWYDLKTREFEACRRFYTGLFGWGRNETGRPAGPYAMIRALDRDPGGIIPIRPEEAEPSHWIGYVGVGDVEACVEALRGQGGSVPLPPTRIPEIGIFAIVSDPFGATLSPFQWTGRSAAPLPTGAGAFCWSELLTPDPHRVESFYRGAFGWRVERGRPGAYGAYWLFRRAEPPERGIRLAGLSADVAGGGIGRHGPVGPDARGQTGRENSAGVAPPGEPILHPIRCVGNDPRDDPFRGCVLREPSPEPLAVTPSR